MLDLFVFHIIHYAFQFGLFRVKFLFCSLFNPIFKVFENLLLVSKHFTTADNHAHIQGGINGGTFEFGHKYGIVRSGDFHGKNAQETKIHMWSILGNVVNRKKRDVSARLVAKEH